MNNFPTIFSNGIISYTNYNDLPVTATDLSTKMSTSITSNPINKSSVLEPENLTATEQPKLEPTYTLSSSTSPTPDSIMEPLKNALRANNTNNNNPSTTRTKSVKSGNKKSFVWKYFKHPQTPDGIEDRTRTECLECKSQLAFNASGTTTTMLNHLKSRHPKIAENEELTKKTMKNILNGNDSNIMDVIKKNQNATSNNCVNNNNNNNSSHNNDGDSANDSFLSIDMSKTSNPSPTDFKINSNNSELNIWPLIKAKPENLDTANQLVYLSNPMLQSIVMTTNHRSTISSTGSSNAIQMSPIALTTHAPIASSTPTQQYPTNLSTTTCTATNNNSLVTNNSSSHSSSSTISCHNNSLDFSLINKKDEHNPSTQLTRHQYDIPSSPTPQILSISSLTSNNNSILSSTTNNQNVIQKRKRKNHPVNRINMNVNNHNSGGIQVQKKFKSDNRSNISDCSNDLASIQSINNILSGNNFLKNSNLCDDNNNNNGHFNTMKLLNGVNSSSNIFNNDNKSNSLLNMFNNYLNSSDNVLAYWLVRDLRPCSILDEPGTKMMFSLLMPSVSIPPISLIKNTVIPSIYNCIKSEILNSFTPDTGCAFSIELWDSIHNNSSMYASLKFHYYSSTDNKLNCKMLRTKEINAKYLCSDLLISCCNELRLDLSSNSSTSFLPVVMNRSESLQDELANVGIIEQNKQFAIIPCLINSLQEVAQVGFQEPEVMMFLEKCRELRDLSRGYNLELDTSSSIPSSQHHHINNNQHQHISSSSPTTLSSPSSTISSTSAQHDWRNSRYICDKFQLIHWVHSNLDYIDEKLDGFNTHRFSKEDETFLRQLMPLLEHIYQTLSVIEQNNLFFSASMIKSIVLTMSKSPFQPRSSDHPGVIQFKRAVKSRLDQIYPNTGSLHEVLWIATLLDPRFKKYHDFSSEEKLLIQKIKNQLTSTSSNASTDSSINPPPSTATDTEVTHNLYSPSPQLSTASDPLPRKQDLHFMFGDDCVSSAPTSELDQYLTEHKIEIEKNPIDWWLTNSSRYPKLAPIALKYLCIPLSNQSGNPITPGGNNYIQTRRKELLPHDIDYYLFLHHNWN